MTTPADAAVLPQQRTPTLRQIVQFCHFERTFAAFPGAHDPALWASLLGLAPEHYMLMLHECAQEAARLGDRLAEDAAARAALAHLDLKGRTVHALGDSITADRCGWFEVIRSAVGTRAAEAMHNVGGTGDTTVHALTRAYGDVIGQRPHVVVVALGTNDARRHGLGRGTELSTPEGYRERLTAIAGSAAAVRARCVLVTPPPVLAAAQEPRDGQCWTQQGVAERAAVVRELGTALQVAVADVHEAFLAAPDLEDLYLPDGLHPGPEGQLLLARTVLPQLAQACA